MACNKGFRAPISELALIMGQGARGMLCEQKVSVYAALGGRTRRIRTADLYHVKADRLHQDTRRRLKTSARTMWRQGSQGTDAREKG